MPGNINFLKDRVAKLRKKSRRVFLIKTWSLIILFAYTFLALSSFSYMVLIKKANDALAQKIKAQEKIIEDLQPIEAKQIYLAAKTKSLGTILASKRKNQEIIESLLALLPAGVEVSDFQIEPDGTVSFNASSYSFKDLTNFLDILTNASTGEQLKIKNSQIGGVSYGLKQAYLYSVTILFYLENQ